MIKIKLSLISLVIFLIIFSMNVSAFAVTSYYWDEKPLIVEPGQTVEVKAFGLQNLLDGEDITAIATLSSGKEIAQMIDGSNVYFVPFGSKDVYINLRITIPKDDSIGKEYNVGVSLSTLPGKEGKTVQLVGGIDNSIKVKVGKVTEEKIFVGADEREIKQEILEGKSFKKSNLLLSLIVLIIIVVSIYYFWFLKKR